MASVYSLQFIRSAVLGSVIGLGVVGGYLAVGQAKVTKSPAVPGVPVKGFRVASTFKGDAANPRLEVSVWRGQATDDVFDGQVQLVRSEFSGSLVSRSFQPSDMKITVLDTEALHVKTSADGSVKKTIGFHFSQPKAIKGVLQARILVAGKPVTVATMVPKVESFAAPVVTFKR